uniref:Myeloid leukemia factor n=1 Tax=Panagrellus redivivus TaxID=6233 RepID=A0A7E4V7W7_PANRE
MFGDDPFDPFGTRRHMQQMDRMMDQLMGNPFGMMDNFFGRSPCMNPSITNGSSSSSSSNSNPRRRTHDASDFGMGMMSPFGGMGMFGNMGMGSMLSQMQNDPNSMVFSSSTMVTYDGNGQPRVVQNTVRKTGDVKETRRSVRDGEVEEVAVGHAIGDREHVIEKKRGSDGRVRKNQRFVNLDESEAETFNNEFRTRSRNPFAPESQRSSHRAIQNGGNPGVSRVPSSRVVTTPSSSGSSAPIIEIPDDDMEEEVPRHRSRGHIRSDGPVIREIDDDDELPANNASKRRRGFF